MDKKKKNKKLTIDEIAQEIGCSKSTVSRALSGKGRIGEDLRNKILVYSNQQGYSPNIAAKALAESRTYNVAVILPADQDVNEIPFFQNCLLGISDTASSFGYDVLVVTMEGSDISRIRNIVENHKVDCAIITRTLVEDETVSYLLDCDLPFLVIGSVYEEGVLQVNSHHRDACKEFTAQLLKGKDGLVGFIGGCMSHTVSQKRFHGFQEGLSLIGRKEDSCSIHLNCTNKSSVFMAVESLVEQGSAYILCMDDKICSQVLVKLNEIGVSVPENIKVASFYDSLFLQSYYVPITALQFDEKNIGKVAAKVLLESLKGKNVNQKTYLGYDIAWRKSTK